MMSGNSPGRLPLQRHPDLRGRPAKVLRRQYKQRGNKCRCRFLFPFHLLLRLHDRLRCVRLHCRNLAYASPKQRYYIGTHLLFRLLNRIYQSSIPGLRADWLEVLLGDDLCLCRVVYTDDFHLPRGKIMLHQHEDDTANTCRTLYRQQISLSRRLVPNLGMKSLYNLLRADGTQKAKLGRSQITKHR